MTQEALKLALEAMYPIAHNTTDDPRGQAYKAITAINKALAQTQEPWCMKMNGCKTKCEDCPVEVAQPEQEPVFRFQMQLQDGWGGQYPKAIPIGDPDFESLFKNIGDIVTFYAAPPQRTWVGLTLDEIKEYLLKPVERDLLSFTRFIEAKLKQKNGYAEENT